MQTAGSGTFGRDRRRTLGAGLVALAVVLAATFLLQKPAQAGDSYTWTGEGNGTSWTDPCNWYEEGACQQKYPGSEATDDTANVEGLPGGPSAVTLGENIALASLNLGKGPTGASVTGGGFTLSRGLGWTGGTLKTDITLAAGSSGTVGGSDYKELNGTLNNDGRLSLDSGILNLANAAKIENAGTFSIAKGSRVQGLVCCLTPPRINSTGRVEVGSFLPIPGADTATIDAVSFNAANTVDVGGGVLEVRWAPGRIAAGTTFTGDGTFRVTNKAEMTMAGAFGVAEATEFELDSCSGTCNQASLSGTGTMNGGGSFMWTGGDVDGELTLGQQIDTFIAGPAPKDLDGRITNIGRTLFRAGDPDGPATGRLNFGGGAHFANPGVFVADERVEMAGIAGCCSPPTANFDNTGTFTAAAPGGTPEEGVTTVRSMGFRAGGTVHVESGALELRSGAATIPEGARITGTGPVVLTQGQTARMGGAFDVAAGATLQIGSCTPDACSNGRLEGTGTLGGRGSLRWVSGDVGTGFTGATDSLTIAEGSRLSLGGRAPKQLKGKLTNRGSAFFTSPKAPAPAAGPLLFGSNGRFVNAATFNLGDRSVLQSGVGCCGDGSADLVNLGKLDMTETLVPATGSVTLESLVFENRGTVELGSGTLRLGRLGGYNQLAGATRLTGGTVESAGQDIKLTGGSLVGAGTITADVENAGATVAPGAPGTASSTGVVKVVGDYTHSASGATFKADLKGATAGTGFDQIRVTGLAQVTRGKLDLKTATGFSPGLSTKLKVLTAGQRSGGGFTQLLNTGLPNGREWHAIYNPTDVTLGVRKG